MDALRCRVLLRPPVWLPWIGPIEEQRMWLYEVQLDLVVDVDPNRVGY